MKYCILILIMLAQVFSLRAQEGNEVFTVSGNIKGLNFPMYIDYTHPETGYRVWDTLFVENERFTYSARIYNTQRIVLWPLLASGTMDKTRDKMRRVEFLVKPGEHVEFIGELNESFDIKPTGTELCEHLNKYNLSLEPNNLKPSELKTKKIDFIKNNPHSEVSAWILSDLVMKNRIKLELASKLLTNIDQSLVDSPFFIDVKMRLDAADATFPGNQVPQIITDRTLDSSEFDINFLKGKFVLIDFWGTWCGPCVTEMPTLKEYAEKYKDRLVVVGINSGDTKARIEGFTRAKNYDWIQIMSKKGLSED